LSEERSTTSRILINMAAFIIIIAGMKASASFIVRLMLGFFLAIISSPLFFFLQRLKYIPKALALLLTLIVIIAMGFGIGALLGSSVNDFVEAFPEYQARFTVLLNESIDWIEARSNIDISTEAINEIFNLDMLVNLITNLFSSITSVMSDTFLIIIMIVFILLEASSIPAKIHYIWGKKSDTTKQVHDFTHGIQRYIGIKTVASLVTGVLVGILMTIIDVDFPLLWGLLAFLLNFIPTIGSILASIPPIFLALVQYGFLKAILTLVAFLSVNMLIGNFLEPRMLGRRLGQSPLFVFISLIFWGWVLGPVGMLLSVPISMSVKIFLESREDTRWMAVLIDYKIPEPIQESSDDETV